MLGWMLVRLGRSVSSFFRSSVPDPFVLAILLTAAVFVAAWGGTAADAELLVRSWQAGFWDLLAFAMQMCLILVTGYALASSPPVARVLRGLAGWPATGRQGVAMTALVAMGAGLVNWGFGLIVGAVLARDIERRLRSRGVVVPSGLLPAAGYTAMLVWHGGLSGSAPLKAADLAGQEDVLGAELAGRVGAIPLSETLLGMSNLVITGGVVVIAVVLLVLMCPRGGDAVGEREPAPEPTGEMHGVEPEFGDPSAGALPRFLEGSPIVVWVVALPAFAWIGMRLFESGLEMVNLNAVNLLFLALGLTLHGSVSRYGRAVSDAASGCAGIIVQFPLYAGIMGMLNLSAAGAGDAVREAALAPSISAFFVGLAGESEGALRVLTFASAAFVNLVVPSGGGQWAVQGPISMSAAVESGASPGGVLMAVAYGDQLTNMLQPFWALPLLAITKAKAGAVVGYTSVVMVASGAWIVVGLLVL